MKKTKIYLICCILTIFVFLLGCQPTPVKDVVVNKNDTASIASSESAYTPSAVAENSNQEAPLNHLEKDILEDNSDDNLLEKWNSEFETPDGVQIHVDANIIAPSQDNYSVLQVKMKGFSNEMIQPVVSVLAGEKSIYNSTGQYYSKEVIEKEIIKFKKKNEDLKSSESYNQNMAANNNIMIENLEELYAITPSKAEWEAAREQVAISDLTNTNSDIMFEIDSDQVALLNVLDKSDSLEDGYYASLICQVFASDMVGGAYVHQIDEDHAYYDAMQKAAITAVNLVDEMKIADMGIADYGVAIDTDLNISKNTDMNYMYSIFFTKEYDDLNVSYVNTNERAVNTSADGDADSYRPPMINETLRINIDKDGETVVGLEWTDPTKIEAVLEDDVAIIDAENIKDVFAEKVKYVFTNNSEYSKDYEIFINKIRLGYYYLPVKDVFNEYVLTPCWFFFGNDNISASEYSETDSFAHAFLILNAIDGSIVT